MLNKKAKSFTINKLLRTIVLIFIDTFFSVYFFTLCNYEILPMAKYYLIEYIALPIGFFLIRKAIKNNLKLPYYRISISLLGVYLAIILLLKERLVDYYLVVAFIKGLANGFYYYPTNVFDAEIISNEERVKYGGLLNTVNTMLNIIIPLILGFILTKFSYINTGKIFMIIIIMMFVLSFNMTDLNYNQKKFEMKKFINYLKKVPELRSIIQIRFLEGLTYSSSVLNVIISIYSIIYLKTNLNIGILNSALAVISLITTTLFAYKTGKKDKMLINISLCLISLSLCLILIIPNIYTLIIYLIINNSLITFINILDKTKVTDFTNKYEIIKNTYKAEYHLLLEYIINLGRITGYIILVIISLFGNIEYFRIITGISLLSFIVLLIKLKKIHE